VTREARAREPDELITAARFPIQATRRVAFREVARRHGDFAMVAIAAIADSRGAATLGVGGMAGKPLVRAIDGGTDAVTAWAEQLEGYEDLHASAAMRRDLFKNLAPDVIAEAQKCAA